MATLIILLCVNSFSLQSTGNLFAYKYHVKHQNCILKNIQNFLTSQHDTAGFSTYTHCMLTVQCSYYH